MQSKLESVKEFLKSWSESWPIVFFLFSVQDWLWLCFCGSLYIEQHFLQATRVFIKKEKGFILNMDCLLASDKVKVMLMGKKGGI